MNGDEIIEAPIHVGWTVNSSWHHATDHKLDGKIAKITRYQYYKLNEQSYLVNIQGDKYIAWREFDSIVIEPLDLEDMTLEIC